VVHNRRLGTASETSQHRRRLRWVAAALCAAVASVYYMIGAGVITVAEATEDQVDLVVFGVGAGTIFALGAVLLLITDHRALWAAGAVLQVGIVAMYLNVASQRTPTFEAWGISLRLAQLVILGLLAYLAIRPRHGRDETGMGRRSPSRQVGQLQ
jgi:cytochrome c biogenesis protein CcdA